MNTLLAMLSFFAFIFAVTGMIHPRLAPWIGERSRKKIGSTYLILSIAFFIGFGLTMDPVVTKATTAPEHVEQAQTPNQNKTKEELLLISARKIPASDYQGNIDAYSKLLVIDPKNKMYAEKIAHYRELLAKSKVTKDQPMPSYTIVHTEELLPYKRSFDIRLEAPISEKQLGDIAQKLKASYRKKTERTFICYFLPGMAPGAGAWATTHFNPSLKVIILGTAPPKNNNVSTMLGRDITGEWIQHGAAAKRTIIYVENGDTFVEFIFPDSSSYREKLKKKDHWTGNGYEEVENEHGEYYVINKVGDLEIWDEFGLIDTAKKG